MKTYLSGILFILFTFILSGCSDTQDVQNDKKITLPKNYSERFHEDLRYGLFTPKDYSAEIQYPLVVYLHGSTDTVSWNLSWYHDDFQEKNPSFILTPKSLKEHNGWGSSWETEHSEDARKTLQVIAELIEKYSIDKNKLFVYGASMGGFGTFSFLAKEPGMFAAAFSICGGGDPNTAENLIHTPLWIFHGSDDKVVSVDLSRNMYKAIVERGSKMVRYTEYPGVGHASWTPAWKEPSLNEWLVSHTKGETYGNPDPPENLSYINEDDLGKISWQAPSDSTNLENQIWYYKIFKDGKLISDLNHLKTTYVDSSGSKAENYSVSAVNYFFNESIKINTK